MISLKLFAFLSLFKLTLCGNILFLNGIASPSHHLWNRVLVNELVKKGHNITMISSDPDNKPNPNIHYILLEATYSTIYAENSFDLLEISELTHFSEISGFYKFCELNCEGNLKSKGLDIILNYPNDFKFEAVIHDFTCGPCLLPLLHKFNYPPQIAVSAFNHPPFSHHLTGGQKYPAYVPHYTNNHPQLMNFPQRAFNTLLYAVDSM